MTILGRRRRLSRSQHDAESDVAAAVVDEEGRVGFPLRLL